MKIIAFIFVLVALFTFLIFFINIIILFFRTLLIEYEDGLSIGNIFNTFFGFTEIQGDSKLNKNRKRVLIYGGISFLFILLSAYLIDK